MRTRARRSPSPSVRTGRVRTLLEWRDQGKAHAREAPGGVGGEARRGMRQSHVRKVRQLEA